MTSQEERDRMMLEWLFPWCTRDERGQEMEDKTYEGYTLHSAPENSKFRYWVYFYGECVGGLEKGSRAFFTFGDPLFENELAKWNIVSYEEDPLVEEEAAIVADDEWVDAVASDVEFLHDCLNKLSKRVRFLERNFRAK